MDEDRSIGNLKQEEPAEAPIYSNSWAVVIGLNSYQDEKIPNLRYAESDAKAVAELLPELGFPQQNITLLLPSETEDLTSYSLTKLTEELDQRMSEHDRFLFYFAGHGVTVKMHGKRSGWLLTPGSRIEGEFADGTQDLMVRPQRAIDMSALLHEVDMLRAKHKLLILDSCFSGFISRTRDVETVPQRTPDLLRDWTSRPVTEFLVAGGAEHKSAEKDELGHGVFTYHLLEGLRGAAAVDGQPIIASHDLAAYLKRRVPQSGVHQDPQYGKYGDADGTFCFERQPRPTVPAKPGIPGEDIEVPLTLNFLDAALGRRKAIGLSCSVRCKECGGKALTGCSSCGGRGLVRKSKMEGFTIAAGVEDGARLLVPIDGNAGLHGAPDGRVYARVSVWPHPDFRKNGLNMESEAAISATLALKGGEITVETIHGPVPLTIPAGTSNATMFRIAGKGIAGGDHRVTLAIETSRPITVALDGSGDYRDINSAIGAALKGGTILVKPGLYQELVELRKDVTLLAQGKREEVIIEGGLVVLTEGGAVIGFTLRAGAGRPISDSMIPVVDIPMGATKFENCQVTGSEFNISLGVSIKWNATPSFRGCDITKCHLGLSVRDSGGGSFESCEFSDHRFVGIQVETSGELTFRGCSVTVNKDGLLILAAGVCLVEECQFFGNSGNGVAIMRDGNARFVLCSFQRNGGGEVSQNAVEIGQNARGWFETCTFMENAIDGLSLETNGFFELVQCVFKMNKGSGVRIEGSGALRFSDCEFAKNLHNGIEIRGGNASFSQCISEGNFNFGASVSASTAEFTDCEFRNNENLGLLARGGEVLVKHSRFYGNAAGLVVDGDCGGLLVECEFFSNYYDGIVIQGGGNPSLVRTKSFKNDQYGISATHAAAGSLTECSVWDNRKGDYFISSDSTITGIPPEVKRTTI